MEKNFKKIAVISFEAGSAEIISNYIKNKNIKNYIFFLNKITKKIFQKNGIDKKYFKKKINEKIIKKIIFGASYDGKEIKLISQLKLKIATECFLDHWVFYKKRFSLRGKIFSPDRIIVFDKFSYNSINKINFKRTKILVRKNFFISNLKKRVKKRQQAYNAVIFLNNVNLHNENNKIYISNKFLIKKTMSILDRKNIFVKLHPANKKKIYYPYLKKFKNLILIKKGKLEKILSTSNLIISNNSQILPLAKIFKIKNINIIKGKNNIIPKEYLDKIVKI